jgi:hypothetical protein
MRNVILCPVMKFKHEKNYETTIVEFSFINEQTVEKQKLSKHDYLVKLKEFLTVKKYPAGCESNYKTESGIMPGHAFSLLEVKTIDIKGQSFDVLKIFNPYNRNK